MATSYRIDRFPFVFWDGDPPRFPTQVTQEIARPGVDGVSLRTLGRRGPTSVASLTSWHANWFAARRAMLDYDTLVGLDPLEVWWNRRRLKLDYQCLYQVEAIEEVDCRANVRLFGSGYNLAGGVSLVTRWTLLPVSLEFITQQT